MAFIDVVHKRLETAIAADAQTSCADRRCKSHEDLRPWPPRQRFALRYCPRGRRRKAAAVRSRRVS